MADELLACNIPLRLKPAISVPADRPIPQWWGRAVQAWFLSVVREKNPDLAEELHRENSLHPYTVSSLIGFRKNESFDPERQYQIRITSLIPELSDLMRQEMEPHGAFTPGADCILDYLPFQIESDRQNDSSSCTVTSASYASIIGKSLQQAEESVFDFWFISPTMFSSEDKTQPLPLPGLVFHALTKKWNAFSPITLPEEITRYAAECLAVSSFHISSVPVRMQSAMLRIGTVGKMRFRAIPHDRYWITMIHALTSFAPFSGVGAGTAWGLGQCRMIPDR